LLAGANAIPSIFDFGLFFAFASAMIGCGRLLLDVALGEKVKSTVSILTPVSMLALLPSQAPPAAPPLA